LLRAIIAAIPPEPISLIPRRAVLPEGRRQVNEDEAVTAFEHVAAEITAVEGEIKISEGRLLELGPLLERAAEDLTTAGVRRKQQLRDEKTMQIRKVEYLRDKEMKMRDEKNKLLGRTDLPLVRKSVCPLLHYHQRASPSLRVHHLLSLAAAGFRSRALTRCPRPRRAQA
jgi:hypothetical protein